MNNAVKRFVGSGEDLAHRSSYSSLSAIARNGGLRLLLAHNKGELVSIDRVSKHLSRKEGSTNGPPALHDGCYFFSREAISPRKHGVTP